MVIMTCLYILFLFEINKEMEVISHKAPGKGVGNRGNIFTILLEEIMKIAIFEKDLFTIITTVVYMIMVPRL